MQNKLPIAVSFGGGVQSTAMLHLVLDGQLPRPDVWIFADVGDEPHEVYEHVRVCEALIVNNGMHFETVRHPSGLSVSQHTFQELLKPTGGVPTPMFLARKAGDQGAPLRRSCTRDWKLKPIWSYLRERYAVKRGQKTPACEVWVGISLDEIQRMKDSPKPWLDYRYPLIELRLRRSRLITYLRKKLVDAPRSACTFCPFHTNTEWRRLKTEDPLGFAAAVAYEQRVHRLWAEHHHRNRESLPYLHRSMQPLESVRFGEEQIDMFGGMNNECDGFCGI